ncbi:MAG TPA: hypothetical protein VKQ32_03550 [Polyangia bacterium]|nr:hypothetical protein [Polyangia bacterium]
MMTSPHRSLALLLPIALLAAARTARAQYDGAPPVAPLIASPPAAGAGTPPPLPSAPPPADDTAADEEGADAAEQGATAEDERYQELEEQVRLLRTVVNGRKPMFTLGGYADVGFFATQGDGSGFIQDVGPPAMRYFPQYASQYGWVFLGDILSTAINSRGEPADLGNPPGVDRQDLIDSNGAPSFIVNEVNLTLNAALADSVIGKASVDFMPRTGTDFRLGDAFEVDIASLEWQVGAMRRTSIYIGKFDSVLGIEYRQRKSNQRFGITPSLIARYTTGTPIGIKVRSRIGPDDLLTVAGAVTNGTSVIETFHFYDETDSNAGKTVSGRVSIAPPLPRSIRLELGASGLYGAQDRALDSIHPIWFAGADLQFSWQFLSLTGEFLRGSSDGEVGPPVNLAHRVYGLRLNNGGYLTLTAMLSRYLGVLVRGDLRDAFVWLGDPTLPGGAERLYVTKSWRLTGGVRVVVNERIVGKIEYLHNGEYGGVPSIPNDVFTTSVVMSY